MTWNAFVPPNRVLKTDLGRFQKSPGGSPGETATWKWLEIFNFRKELNQGVDPKQLIKDLPGAGVGVNVGVGVGVRVGVGVGVRVGVSHNGSFSVAAISFGASLACKSTYPYVLQRAKARTMGAFRRRGQFLAHRCLA